MKTSHYSYLFIFALIMSSCSFGGNIAELPVAQQIDGENVRVLLKENWIIYGELLSVVEDSITILAESINKHITNRQIKPKPLPAVANIALENIGSVHLLDINHTIFKNGEFFKYKNIEPRYFSRFPQNINSDVMERLLTTYQQDSLWVL